MGNHQGILQPTGGGKKIPNRHFHPTQPLSVQSQAVETDFFEKAKDLPVTGSSEDPGPLSLMSSNEFTAELPEEVPKKRTRANTIGVRPIVSPKKSKERRIPTVFKLTSVDLQKAKMEPLKKQIYLCGSFDNWTNLIPMNESHSNFVTILELPEGDYQYKFKVDDVWVVSSKDPVTSDGFGGQNNLIKIQTSDNEVFEALDMDIREKTSKNMNEFGQEVPIYGSGKDKSSHNHPPILPPHLLQVILNKDTPLSCEPTLLPTPNHVMINHLYALSIKDRVMVMSSTQRFRKKYVTTVLYRPIDE